jgi:proteasome lid subunit RPN8/RPN11
MNTKVKQAIIDHALASPKEEVCGLIYHTLNSIHAYPCENVSKDPDVGRAGSFEIDPQDYATVAQMGRVCGVYHSHISDPAIFSEEDILVARELAVPFYLYSLGDNQWVSYIPDSYTINPIGQPWIWGFADCWEVVRTYYRQNKRIYLTDSDRDESFENAEASAITKYIEAEGFSYIKDHKDMQRDDLLLFTTPGSCYPHHLAVFIGNSRMMHHPQNCLSTVDPIDGKWLKRLVGVLRYTGKSNI